MQATATSLSRRAFVALLPGALAPAAFAEHGWTPAAGATPLYLEGEVTVIIWADPHPHLELVHRTDAVLPADLRTRSIPGEGDAARTAALLAAARLPSGTDRIWRVELPSLARLGVWEVPRPRVKQVVALVGLPGPPLLETPTVQAEILFIGGRAYPMRAGPR